MVVLTDKFRFIRDDVFLCPWVDTDTGKQKLVIQKIDLTTNEVEFENSIDCIHTAVTIISTEEFEDYQNDADAQENLDRKTIDIRSSENLTEINLTPKEKFITFKSWTAGIAEAGLNAFHIQDEIDKNLDLLYPISNFLFRFMAKVDSDFIPEYLMKIERDCMFEGFRHESSFIASSIPILEMIWFNYMKNDKIQLEDKEILKELIIMDISDKLFKNSLNFQILRMIIEPEDKFKISKDITVLYLEEAWERLRYQYESDYGYYKDGKVIKALIELDNSGKLFKNSLNFLILRILVEPNYKFEINEEDTSLICDINHIFEIIDKPPLKLFLNNYSRYIKIEFKPNNYHKTFNLIEKLNLKNLIFKDQIDKRKTEIKSLSANSLKNHWECDEKELAHKTCFCYDAENRIKLINHEKDISSCNICLCPKILCGRDTILLTNDDKSLNTIIFEKYGKENVNGNIILQTIFKVKDKPEFKLMVEALRMLRDTGELNTGIICKIKDVIYKRQRENRKIEISWLAYDFLHDYWERDEWIIGSETNFCRNTDNVFDFIIPDYFKINGNFNINLCPKLLCDNEICPLNGLGDKSLNYTIYEKYGQEDLRGDQIPLKIADVKEKLEVKLMVEALHMLRDKGELNADIIRRITTIIFN